MCQVDKQRGEQSAEIAEYGGAEKRRNNFQWAAGATIANRSPTDRASLSRVVTTNSSRSLT
jgi:hypothetical protein